MGGYYRPHSRRDCSITTTAIRELGGYYRALNLGASQAIVGEDPAGNRKPLKNKSVHKIDALVAALMGVFPNSDGQVAAKEFDVAALIG